jgi:CxxC-x17-CxxC domain-containing protein
MEHLARKAMSTEDRQMFPATCADCKKETQVPFKPAEGRPVYCKECLPKHRPARRF